MKTNYYLLNTACIFLVHSLIISCSNDNAENAFDKLLINIPDRKFEEILIEQGIDSDKTINQKITKSDAEKITKLDLNVNANFGEIKNLAGIEGFSNLTFLSAANHAIQTINLRSNTELDTLYIHGNQLTEVDFSNNTKLIDIDIQSNEIHTILGLQYATKLKKLNTSWNDLEDFTLNNRSIEILFISHNLLKSLNITQAINLKNIYGIINKITHLDLSENRKLETFIMSDNQLSEINFENNTELTHIYMSSTLISNLDVSSNLKLVDLRIDRNPNLTCIQKGVNQSIPNIALSSYQCMSTNCN